MQTQKNNKVGRPSKLTESRMEKLIEALRSGSYRIDACRTAGIHYNTLLAWEKKGEDEQSGENVEFLDALRKAEAEAVITNVEVITRAAQDGDWKAAAWFLEHKYPDKWAMLVMLLIYYLRPLTFVKKKACLLYTSDAADDLTRVALGG